MEGDEEPRIGWGERVTARGRGTLAGVFASLNVWLLITERGEGWYGIGSFLTRVQPRCRALSSEHS